MITMAVRYDRLAAMAALMILLGVPSAAQARTDAASIGEMLSVRSETPGSAGYVALERVTGTLQGRKGSFVLQHSGTMNRGAPTLVLTVVPDSGTGELAGLSGSMAIIIDQGKHSYTMDYQLP